METNQKGTTEIRFQPTNSTKIEKRGILEDGSGGKEYIVGDGVVFEQRSEKLGGFFYETIKRGSFANADISDVVGLFNHDNNYVLGRSSSGTMTFTIDDAAVRYEILAPDTQIIRDLVLAPIVRRDITGSSFQFSVADEEDADEWRYDKQNQVYYRDIHKVDKLYDLSAVTMPAYSQSSSSVSKRSLDSLEVFKHKQKELEDNEKRNLDHYKRSMAAARVRIYALS